MAPKRKKLTSETRHCKGELDYNHDLPVQTSVERSFFQDISSEPFSGNSPIEFNISGSSREYIDFANTYLVLRVAIQLADGKKLNVSEENTGKSLSISNNFLHSLFANIEVVFNGTHITRSYSNYAYKALLQNLLGYGKDVKENSFLRCEGWSTDEAEKFESLTGKGISARKSWISGSKVFELAAALKIDIAQQHKLIPDGVAITIKCIRHNSEFPLIDLAPDDVAGAAKSNFGKYKIHVESATLRVKKVELSPSEHLRLINDIQSTPFKIPIRRADVTSQSIPANLLSKKIERLYEGQLPRLLFVTFVDGKAYNGDIRKNPYYFQTFNLKEIQCYCNGTAIPSTPYQLDFVNGNYVQPYLALHEAIGSYRMEHSPAVSYEAFSQGNAIYAFTITPVTNCQFVNPIQNGNISIEMKWEKALSNPINIIIYAEYDSLIYINESRQITTDYQ